MEIHITTFSNECEWKTPVVDIYSAKFLYSSLNRKMAGIQYGEKSGEDNDYIEKLCDEIADKIYDLHELINSNEKATH